MDQQIVGHTRALGAQVLDGAVEIDGIPMDNSRGEETEAGGSEALVFEGAVANFALAMEKYRPAQ